MDGWVGKRTHGTRRMKRDCQGRAARRIEKSQEKRGRRIFKTHFEKMPHDIEYLGC